MNRAVNAKMSRQAAAKDASGLADRQRAPKPSGRISAYTKGEGGEMPIRYSIDRINRRLLTHADGLVAFHDINTHRDHEQRNRDLDRP